MLRDFVPRQVDHTNGVCVIIVVILIAIIVVVITGGCLELKCALSQKDFPVRLFVQDGLVDRCQWRLGNHLR